MIRLIKIFIAVFSLILLSNCSFNSKQYAFVNELILSKPSVGPNPEWQIDWLGLKIDVFAINHQNAIYFASYDNHLLGFREKHVFSVKGFSAIADEINIQLSDNKVHFIVDNKIKRTDFCNSWTSLYSSEGTIQIENQVCFADGSDYNRYENNIYYDENDQIIAFTFKIYPEYPSIILRFKPNNQLDYLNEER